MPKGRQKIYDIGRQKNMSKKIIMTGGGTAGHVTPNLALLPTLEKDGFSIVYIGSKKGIEREIIQEQTGLPY